MGVLLLEQTTQPDSLCKVSENLKLMQLHLHLCSFIEMEWAEEYLGDTLMQKEPWRKVRYLSEIFPYVPAYPKACQAAQAQFA